jgi:hypothetical protein
LRNLWSEQHKRRKTREPPAGDNTALRPRGTQPSLPSNINNNAQHQRLTNRVSLPSSQTHLLPNNNNMVQDPNFWRRFSLAVHQDEALRSELAQSSPDLKHSYVPSLSSAPMLPTYAPSALSSMHNLLASPVRAALRPEEIWQHEFESEKAAREEQHVQVRRPAKLKKSASRASTRPLLHKRNQVSVTISLHAPVIPGLRSPSCLSLSGRPKTLFKTWTTCTANPVANRASWLESQQKKSRHRTWICWAFWLSMIALVAGVVVAVLVLRAHGII